VAACEQVAAYGRRAEVRLTLVDPGGAVLCDTQQDAAALPNHADRPEFAAALAGEVGSDTRVSATLSQRMMYLAVPIEHEGRLLGAIRAALSVHHVDDELASVRREVFAWSVVVAGLALVVGWWLARSVARPLEEIRRGAERFAAGELGYALPEGASAEAAGLAQSLNTMARQMEQRIDTIVRQSSQQDAILGSMVEGVLAVDRSQRIISVNQAAADLLSFDRQRAVGRPVGDFVNHPELWSFCVEAITSGEPIQRDIMLDHSQRIIQARGTALAHADKQGHGAVIVLNDVTNVRRLESLRRDFVANVSHELKTPITSIKGFVETLLDGAMDHRSDAERFLRIMAAQAERLGAIVEDLLSLAKIEQSEEDSDLELHKTPIRPILEMAVRNCQALAEQRRVAVELDCPAELAGRANPPLLEQAVTNLLDNAIKYSPCDRRVEIRATASSAEVVIAVRDEGVGIAAEHLPRLFERFYRVDKARSRKAGGTGLGLAIVKHIASAHRGSVSVESTPGVGSTFTMRISA
jgi:two-component system phosphate regulon sensor histidine kinase PhoR